jgi:hypothetical protein
MYHPHGKGLDLKSSGQGSFLQWFTNHVPRFSLKDEDSFGGASISGASNGGATFLFLLI